jgi:hypothetical protein
MYSNWPTSIGQTVRALTVSGCNAIRQKTLHPHPSDTPVAQSRPPWPNILSSGSRCPAVASGDDENASDLLSIGIRLRLHGQQFSVDPFGSGVTGMPDGLFLSRLRSGTGTVRASPRPPGGCVVRWRLFTPSQAASCSPESGSENGWRV